MCLRPKLINARFVEQQSQILDHFIWRMVGAWPLAKYCRDKCWLNVLANTFYKAWMSPVLGSEGLSVSKKSWQTVLFTWQELGEDWTGKWVSWHPLSRLPGPSLLNSLGRTNAISSIFCYMTRSLNLLNKQKKKKKTRTNNFAITRKKIKI